MTNPRTLTRQLMLSTPLCDRLDALVEVKRAQGIGSMTRRVLAEQMIADAVAKAEDANTEAANVRAAH